MGVNVGSPSNARLASRFRDSSQDTAERMQRATEASVSTSVVSPEQLPGMSEYALRGRPNAAFEHGRSLTCSRSVSPRPQCPIPPVAASVAQRRAQLAANVESVAMSSIGQVTESVQETRSIAEAAIKRQHRRSKMQKMSSGHTSLRLARARHA